MAMFLVSFGELIPQDKSNVDACCTYLGAFPGVYAAKTAHAALLLALADRAGKGTVDHAMIYRLGEAQPFEIVTGVVELGIKIPEE